MNPWAALVGRREDGRRAAAAALVAALKERGLRIGGFTEVATEEAGRVTRWDAQHVVTGERRPLLCPSDDPELCDFRMDEGGRAACREWLKADGLEAVVMEVGPLEGRGEGLFSALVEVLEGPPRVPILIVRPRALATIGLRLPDPSLGLELPATEAELGAFVSSIVTLARGQQGR